ncbi:hypothetical protein BBP40_002153 [Aspergillus hancockii]|nr:hypothetical protein BBP40_002153 [Aspergillus hancockii]
MSSKTQCCDVNFMAHRGDVRLHPIDKKALNSSFELLEKYQSVLDQKESFTRYLNVPLLSDVLDEYFSQAFSSRKPPLVQMANTCSGGVTLSWVDVIRDFRPEQLIRNPDGSVYSYARGLLIQLTDEDCDLIKSGMYQKISGPWPHTRDIEAELDTAVSIWMELSEWGKYAAQVTEKAAHLLKAVANRIDILRNILQLPPKSLSLASSDFHPTKALFSRQEKATIHQYYDGVHSTDQVIETELSSDNQQTCQVPREGAEGIPACSKDANTTDNVRSNCQPWSEEEEYRLLPWLEAHQHLSGAMIEQEYLHQFGIGRGELTLKVKALRVQQSLLYYEAHNTQDAFFTPHPSNSHFCAPPAEYLPRSPLESGTESGTVKPSIARNSEVGQVSVSEHGSAEEIVDTQSEQQVPSRLRWSTEEQCQLLSWLDRHSHLTWTEKEQEYAQHFGVSRGKHALRRKASKLQQKRNYRVEKTRTRGVKTLVVSLPLPRDGESLQRLIEERIMEESHSDLNVLNAEEESPDRKALAVPQPTANLTLNRERCPERGPLTVGDLLT